MLQKAVPTDGTRMTAKALTLRAETWRPWRAYAVMHLWNDSICNQVPALASAGKNQKRSVVPAKAGTQRLADGLRKSAKVTGFPPARE